MKIRIVILSIILLLNLIGLSWGAAQNPGQAAPQQNENKPATADEIVKQGDAAYQKKEFAKAGNFIKRP